MATYLVRYSEGDPLIVVAESFVEATERFMGKIVDDDMLDMMSNPEQRAGTSPLDRETVRLWIDAVEKLSDDDPVT